KTNALTQVLLHSYDFEGDTVGQDPSGVTLSVIEPAGSGTANVDNLGDVQQNHVAVHKDGGTQRVELRDNISYYGNTFDAGIFHCKIYHDDSLFGILFHDDIGVLFRLDWFDGIIGRWSPYEVYTTYNYNQWYDVVVYFNISLGWMFEIDGVRFGDGYAYPFEHGGSGGLEWIRWCSAFSGGGNGFFRVDDVEFYYYEEISTVGFFDDFESGVSKWQSITGLWHLTDTGSAWPDPCHSPTHAMWFGDESTGTFETGFWEYGELVSVPFSLLGVSMATLEFYHWRAGEGGSFDVSYVYISIDGINWDLLYQSSSDYIAPWEQVSLDISGYVGNPNVQLKFFFDTLDSIANNYRGWLVDDIQVLTYYLSHDLSVSLDTPVNPQIGNSYIINATVTNTGLNDEYDVDLLLYLDDVIVESTTISILPVDASETISYMWIPIDYRIYNFTVYAPPISGETLTANNFITEIINTIPGNVILFDEAHSPMQSIGGGYSEFAGMLTAAGHTVNTIDPGTVIDATVLSGCDILVIAVSQNAYTVAELDAIENWVGVGGSLLLITDWGSWGMEMNPLAARFGFVFRNDAILDSDDDIGGGGTGQNYYDGPNILSHPITAGVSRVEMYAADGLIAGPFDEIPIIITDTDGTATWYLAGTPALGVSLMSVVDSGSAGAGKVCVIGDSNLWDSNNDQDGDGVLDFYDSDNEILAWNTINWLTPPPPDSLAVTAPDFTSSWETGTLQSIKWVSLGSISDVKIELYENDIYVMEIVASTSNDGEFSWLIPTTLVDSTQYQIKISDVANPATDDFSEDFEIFTSIIDSLTVTNPDSLTAWEKGTSQDITWTSIGSIADVKIELYKGGVFEMEIIASTANDGTYNWDIPTDLEDGIDYQIRISDVLNPATYDESPNFAMTSADIPDEIPSYNLYIVIGIMCVVSGILFKKRFKLIK
ncbi:MAG: Ser-Thr-rich GPI-anchored membrane family protein, partial [Promethearchaeota archaeon]